MSARLPPVVCDCHTKTSSLFGISQAHRITAVTHQIRLHKQRCTIRFALDYWIRESRRLEPPMLNQNCDRSAASVTLCQHSNRRLAADNASQSLVARDERGFHGLSEYEVERVVDRNVA